MSVCWCGSSGCVRHGVPKVPRDKAVEARAEGYAAGRAEERADVRRCIVTNAERMLGEMAKSKSATFKRSYRDAIEVLVGLSDIIAKGGHVGAAKKGD